MSTAEAERIQGRQALAETAGRLFSHLSRNLRVVTATLDGSIYAQTALIQRLPRLARADPRASFRFIIGPGVRPNKANEPLVALARRLTSTVAFRQIPETAGEEARELIVVDERSTLRRETPSAYESLLSHEPARARHMAAEFDRLWEESAPAAEWRTLHI